MSAINFGYGLAAGSWDLSVKAAHVVGGGPRFRAWITERGSRKRVITAEAVDRESAAFLALQGYVGLLRQRLATCQTCQAAPGAPCVLVGCAATDGFHFERGR